MNRRQDEPEDVTEELGDLLQGDELQGKPELYLVCGALSLRDEFQMGGASQEAMLDKKWDVLDEDGERNYGDDVKAAFKDLTGAEAGGPDKEGDTELELDEDGRVVGMEDWWINDDREGRWIVVVDEWPYFNFERQL